MKSNKKKFNYTILFFILYGALAVIVLAFIWWPRDSKNSNTSFKYENIDFKKKASGIYSVELNYLLSKNDLPALYEKLDDNYKKQYNINETNYISYLEQTNYISDNIKVGDYSINIQDDIYVYRFTYFCNGRKCYVNLIETKPYEYTISFEQENIPLVNNTKDNSSNAGYDNNTKISTIDNVEYVVTKSIVRENSVTYNIKITNKSDNVVKFNFDNITNISAVLDDGKEVYIGGAVISSEDDNLNPDSYIEKELFFAINSEDQSKVKALKIRDVNINDETKTVNINL